MLTLLTFGLLNSEPESDKILCMIRHGAVVTLFLCLPIIAAAQATTGNAGDMGNELNLHPSVENHLGASLVVTVVNEKKKPLDRQAVIKLYDQGRQRNLWQVTGEDSQTAFMDLTVGKFSVEVSAVGYIAEQKDVMVFDFLRATKVEVTLKRDPEAVDLDIHAAPLPKKANMETKRAIAYLNNGKLKDAQKQLEAAYKVAPESGQVNFLLGYLSLQQRNFQQAQTYLEKSTTLDPHNVQALNLLGRVYLNAHKFPEAQAVLQRAAAADPENWIAHNLLANAYEKQRDYAKALEQADLALAGNKPGSVAAQVTRGVSLANTGHDKEAIEAFDIYLQSVPTGSTAEQVHEVIDQIKNRPNPQVAAKTATTTETKTDVSLAAAQTALSLKAWGPQDIDETKPVVAAGVTCPYQEIVERTGERVKQLVDNVAQFAAIEDMLHEQLDELGNPTSKQRRKFDYVAAISEPQKGVLQVSEYRKGDSEIGDLPDHIVTNGFPALALAFHPHMRENFNITCEGLGQLGNQATWLMRFEQRSDRPNRLQNYKVGDYIYSVPLKGRAWISANSFQIVRMESQMVQPMPDIQFLAEHQITEYGPVAFPKKNVELWLPKSAEVYLALRGHLYYRRHSFDHFMLFAVDSSDKLREANGAQGASSISR